MFLLKSFGVGIFVGWLVIGVGLAGLSWAEPVSVVVTEEEQGSWGLIGDFMERCVSGAAVRADASACRNVYAFTAGFAAKVAAAQQAARAAKEKAPVAVPAPVVEQPK